MSEFNISRVAFHSKKDYLALNESYRHTLCYKCETCYGPNLKRYIFRIQDWANMACETPCLNGAKQLLGQKLKISPGSRQLFGTVWGM